ncbi:MULTISPECIES: hypothetical protein [Streptomyces]|uniref:hypothetical protein n=1 Tax=Streptomyces TaxID=1883 RepID=UPI000E68122C|nr:MULTISPECIES: hypothetical protein [Streptomyces]MDX3065572.1 hypothetical protein [Streptomyces sp. ND04-05B]MDX3519516.1 hypothetical protein [Streptomyces scabiei]
MTNSLARTIAREDALEEAGMPADERTTCYAHKAWAFECADQHLPLTAGRVLAALREVDRVRWHAAGARRRP